MHQSSEAFRGSIRRGLKILTRAPSSQREGALSLLAVFVNSDNH